jgi:hypothetical protein
MDMINSLKTAFCDICEVWKSFYCVCPPGFAAADQFDLCLKSYAASIAIQFVAWIVYLICAGISAAQACSDWDRSYGERCPYAFGGYIGGIIIGIIWAWVCFAWTITALRRPEDCCIPQCINMWIVTVFVWIAMILNAWSCIQGLSWLGRSWVWIINTLVYCLVLSVQIPMVSYFTRSACTLNQGGGGGGGGGQPATQPVSEPAPASEPVEQVV